MVWRNIKPNHSNAIPRYVIALDTETIKEGIDGRPLEFNNYLRCGCAISIRVTSRGIEARKVLHFTDNRIFWKWLEACSPIRATTWIVAHKMSFDWNVIGGWEAIGNRNFVLDMPRGKRPIVEASDDDPLLARGLCVIDDPPFILGLRSKSGKRYVVVDTLNWFRCPLKQLGKDIGLDKLEMPSQDAPHVNWQMYCERDTEIVEKAFVSLVNFVRENDFGMFRYTAPSQAMSAFRHKHMKHKITLHDEISAKACERAAYFGGELRMMYQGQIKEQVYQLDVNGMYPYVMANYMYPCRLLGSTDDELGLDSPLIEFAGRSIADVTIDTRVDTYPVRTEHATAYCLGEFRTVLCGIELLRAQSTAVIKKYHAYYRYDTALLFKSYIDDLFARRQHYKQTENQAYDMLCKLLLNSLYGKFGQRSYKWRQRPDIVAQRNWSKWCTMDWETNTIELWRSIADYVFHSPIPSEHRDSFPAIPAFVCSAARNYMRELRTLAGIRNVYYQATDSLFVNQEGYMNLLSVGLLASGELGKLKLVATSDRAEFIGPNNYTIGSQRVQAGLPRGAKNVASNRWLVEHFERADGAVAREPTSSVHSWQSIFSERTPQVRGCRAADGWITPLVLSIVQCDPLDEISSGSANSSAMR